MSKVTVELSLTVIAESIARKNKILNLVGCGGKEEGAERTHDTKG